MESPNQADGLGWAETLRIQRDILGRAVGPEGATADKADWIERNAENFREVIENNSEIINLLKEDYEAGLKKLEELLSEMPPSTKKAA